MFTDLTILLGRVLAENGSPGGGDGDGGGEPPGAGPSMFLPFIIILAAMYFIMIRPQRKREKEHRAMLSELKEKDRVITSGGIHGQVIAIKEKEIILRIDDRKDVQIRVLRSSIMGVRGADGPEPPPPTGPLEQPH